VFLLSLILVIYVVTLGHNNTTKNYRILIIFVINKSLYLCLDVIYISVY
jgi:hypothetical protein